MTSVAPFVFFMLSHIWSDSSAVRVECMRMLWDTADGAGARVGALGT